MKEYIAEYIVPVEKKGNDYMFDFVNAKPLIRCKDCKHRPHKDERGNVVPPEEDEELSLCPCVDDNDWYYNYIPMADWYCANGEPKEKET
jgi:disulfide oxidoreductase YuzD